MEKEFNLSEKIVEVSHYDNPWREHLFVKDVKEFIKKNRLLELEFMDKVLNANTKSKNFIEIADFKYLINWLFGEKNKLAGDDLI